MVLQTATANMPDGARSQRVYLLLRSEIAKGVYGESASLPSEQVLAQMFEVSRVTVRRALDALVSNGLIEKRAGSGTRVTKRENGPRQLSADFTSLMPQLAEMHDKTEARLLSFVYAVPAPMIRQAMGLDDQQRVQTAIRVRSMSGQPFSYLTTHVPERFAQNYSEADLATQPLYKLLERSGVKIKSAEQTVSATLATPEVAEALGISIGSSLLAIDRIVRDENNAGVEYLSALYRSDAFQLQMDLNLVGKKDNRHWQPVIRPVGTDGEPR